MGCVECRIEFDPTSFIPSLPYSFVIELCGPPIPRRGTNGDCVARLPRQDGGGERGGIASQIVSHPPPSLLRLRRLSKGSEGFVFPVMGCLLCIASIHLSAESAIQLPTLWATFD